jgi:hypothetical protein
MIGLWSIDMMAFFAGGQEHNALRGLLVLKWFFQLLMVIWVSRRE